MLDAHWAVNTRSTILLAQAFAARHDGHPGGRIVFIDLRPLDLGPMTPEVAYAASKGPRSPEPSPTSSPTRRSR